MVDVEAPGVRTLADRRRAVGGVHVHAIAYLEPLRARAPIHPDATPMSPEPLPCAGPDPGLAMPHLSVVCAGRQPGLCCPLRSVD